MQACAGCGRSIRPQVRYCTQCGRPTSASQAIPRAPTWIAALAVLSIGLLAFLTIRPIVPGSTTPVVAVPAPALPAHDGPAASHSAGESGSVLDDVGSDGVAAGSPPPVAAASVVAQAVSAPEVLPVPATVDAALETTRALLDAESTSFDAASVALDPDFAALDSAPALDAAPALDDPASALGDSASVHEAEPARPSRPAIPPSSSQAKHGALEPALQRRVTKRRATVGRAWLGMLRAELDACDGDFIARTICRERAKFRHCGLEDAWGDVPECPAATVPQY